MLKKRALAQRFRIADHRRAAARRWASCASIITRRSSSRLAGELAKDLTGHPIADIEKALMAA